MPVYVALLRAVNVGGTGKLPMTDLKRLCEEAGMTAVQTYIASGNVLFKSDLAAAAVQAALDEKLRAYAGKPVGLLIRSAIQMAETAARNPFPNQPGNRVTALFTDEPLPTDVLDGVSGRQQEELCLGQGEIFIFYGDGMAKTRLRVPAADRGTARNMNTVAKLAEMAAKL